MILSPEVLKKVAEKVRQKQSDKGSKPTDDFSQAAKKASVTKLMAALKSEDADQFIEAYGEFTLSLEE